ncbi:MAG: 6-phosphogluconolactonase [Candidatus Eremiobacteraeota bacterium]|nr:6-phosphogluconolactonase [Candidatus Eremiobacteraeota bacterium]
MAARGTFTVALSGGTTPKAAYALLAQDQSAAVDWKRVVVFFSDERCVPPGDSRSNYKSARDALLAKVAIPANNIHRMLGEEVPEVAARAYATLLTHMCGAPPRLDLVMLGMGTDGHTASLFPGSDPMTDNEQLVRAPFVQQMQMFRLTMTPRVINASRCVTVATEGAEKADALQRVLAGDYNPQSLPVQAVAPTDGHLIWLVDRAAAGKLSDET